MWRPEDEKKKKGEKDSGRKKKKTKGGIHMPKPEDEEGGEPIPVCPNAFGHRVRAACEAYLNNWHDKDDFDNHEQKFIPDVLKNT
jgi:hypothetical protein